MDRHPQQNNKSDAGKGILYALGGLAVGIVAALAGKTIYDEQKKSEESQIINQTPIQNQNIAQQSQQHQQSNVQTIEEETLLCPISQELIKDAVMLTNCGHTFDRACLVPWIQKNGACPQCRTPATINNIQKNYAIQAVIDKFTQ